MPIERAVSKVFLFFSDEPQAGPSNKSQEADKDKPDQDKPDQDPQPSSTSKSGATPSKSPRGLTVTMVKSTHPSKKGKTPLSPADATSLGSGVVPSTSKGLGDTQEVIEIDSDDTDYGDSSSEDDIDDDEMDDDIDDEIDDDEDDGDDDEVSIIEVASSSTTIKRGKFSFCLISLS